MEQLIWILNKTIYPVYSLIINSFYWLFNINDLNHTLEEKARMKDGIKTEKDISNILTRFIWKKDSLIDWTPWIITIIHQNFKDDCDGAATLGKWLYKCIGVKSNLVVLYKDIKSDAHLVCVRKDKTEMISNNVLVKLDPDKWNYCIMDYFNFKYETIIIV